MRMVKPYNDNPQSPIIQIHSPMLQIHDRNRPGQVTFVPLASRLHHASINARASANQNGEPPILHT